MDNSKPDTFLIGFPLVIATIAVALASFINVLDTTIAIVALPTIAGNLGATPSQATWVITSYSVCLAVILPLSGWIARRFGAVHTFCAAVLLFTVASWLCAMATSFNQLLLFRALQGFAGGLFLPLSQTLLLRIYPPEKHGLALGIWGISSSVAPVLGPMLGGVITDNFGWPWIFLINIPIGLFSVYVCWNLLRDFEDETVREPIDFVGLFLLIVGVICFQLVLDRGHELDWLASTQIRVMLGISVVFFFLFLAWERDTAHPVVDLSLLTQRNFVTGSFMLAIVYMCFVFVTVLHPIWLQAFMGYSPTWAGLVMAPFGLLPILLMPLVGHRLHNWDARATISFGLVIFALAYWMQAQSSTDTSAGFISAARLLMGLAMPFAWMPLMVLALTGLPADKVASATGLFNFIRMLTSSLGMAMGVTLWDSRTIYHRSYLVENMSSESPQYQQAVELLSHQLPGPQAAAVVLERMVTVQARTLALDDIFYLGAFIMVSLIFFAWFLPARVVRKG